MDVMETSLAYLGLGTNLGDREANLLRALKRLGQLPEVEVLRVAAIRETEPWGEPNQPRFLNTVAEISCGMSPEELLAAVQRIERELGRKPTYRWGPRVIDLDLLWFEGEPRDAPELTLPHPGLLERDFVLEPLEELNATLVEELRGAAVSL